MKLMKVEEVKMAETIGVSLCCLLCKVLVTICFYQCEVCAALPSNEEAFYMNWTLVHNWLIPTGLCHSFVLG